MAAPPPVALVMPIPWSEPYPFHDPPNGNPRPFRWFPQVTWEQGQALEEFFSDLCEPNVFPRAVKTNTKVALNAMNYETQQQVNTGAWAWFWGIERTSRHVNFDKPGQMIWDLDCAWTSVVTHPDRTHASSTWHDTGVGLVAERAARQLEVQNFWSNATTNNFVGCPGFGNPAMSFMGYYGFDNVNYLTRAVFPLRNLSRTLFQCMGWGCSLAGLANDPNPVGLLPNDDATASGFPMLSRLYTILFSILHGNVRALGLGTFPNGTHNLTVSDNIRARYGSRNLINPTWTRYISNYIDNYPGLPYPAIGLEPYNFALTR
ncbi:uncharacterized protein JN550_002865 [Neoarthrinium moseri]|uniref:uncharacterized protein n=1 Tax=Neoarthrinium moseri TaxID=1658444 RepID=UPI001FDC7942|nr:uncharacterized protein JN550_002865 [Neoarthrinium moseri]KAI1874286.1 hypothetical protein JN550_002865 [Neoarthrinium moseri]